MAERKPQSASFRFYYSNERIDKAQPTRSHYIQGQKTTKTRWKKVSNSKESVRLTCHKDQFYVSDDFNYVTLYFKIQI